MRNGEIAEAFEELASLYELDGAVVYRVVAYRNAAKAIREAGVSVAEMAREGRVEELAGVGKTIAEKITAATGEKPASSARMPNETARMNPATANGAPTRRPRRKPPLRTNVVSSRRSSCRTRRSRSSAP